jgi:ribosome biogenesis GTPase A
VGKSALINRLVRQTVVDRARRAGVTRSLRWVRLGQDLDRLDAPGVLPPRLDDQLAALRLALCDDIGQAAYDGEAVAMAFVQMLAALERVAASGVKPGLLESRYGVPIQAFDPGLALDRGPAADLSIATVQDSVQTAQNSGQLSAGASSLDGVPAAPRPDADGWLRAAAERHTSGDTARMAQRFLDDFRRGMLGPLALELP